MRPTKLEAKTEEMIAALTDEQGELLPIQRIDFEIIGGQIRWTIWSDLDTPGVLGRRLQSITTRIGEIDGLLEASKLLLEMAMADRLQAQETDPSPTEES